MHSDTQVNILHDWKVFLEAANCTEVCCSAEQGLITKQATDAPANLRILGKGFCSITADTDELADFGKVTLAS